MTSLREAAQQALEALLTYEQYIQPLTNVFGGPRVPEEGSASAKVDAAITALRAALAEPDGPCPTCVSLARAVMMDQMGYDPAPPQRKPLTDEEIRGFYYEHAKYQEAGARVSGWWAFARAIERAHGIGEKN